jgi:Calcineurin-like phosphoesterase
VSYLCLGDIHATDRPPSSCTGTYLDDLLDLLRQTARVARERKVRGVVWAGDVFHIKAASRNSHRLVQLFQQLIPEYGCPVYVVPGNHDLAYDRLDSLAETQPLGVLIRSGQLRMLNGWCRDGHPLYGVPWLQKWTDDAVREALAGWRDQVIEAGTGTAHPLVVTHAPLYPPGLELEFEHYPAVKWAEAMAGAGACYYGHVHERHGIWSAAASWETEATIENGVVTFCNPGAISRGSLHEYNLKRTPACVIWDEQEGSFEEILLDAKPPELVFRLQESQEITDMRGRLDEFLSSVGTTSLKIMTTEAVVAHLRGLNLPALDLSLALDMLSEAAK